MHREVGGLRSENNGDKVERTGYKSWRGGGLELRG